jgi:hypothetical protein
LFAPDRQKAPLERTSPGADLPVFKFAPLSLDEGCHFHETGGLIPPQLADVKLVIFNQLVILRTQQDRNAITFPDFLII